MTYAIPAAELAAVRGPLAPDECVTLARRAASLLDPAALSRARQDEVVGGLLQRTPGPPDEASPESPRLLTALTGR